MNTNRIVLFLSLVSSLSVVTMDQSTYTQSLTSDTKLLQAICQGPKPEDHIFCEARVIKVSEENSFDATVMPPSEDTMNMSIMEFGGKCLEPAFEATSTAITFKTHPVLQSLKRAGTLALICVHGTYSKDMGFGDKIERKSTHAIIDLAHTLGISYNKSVEIISFAWSGILDIKARKEAGKQLADFLIEKKKAYDLVWTIAHSHGCNVVNWAGLDMLKDGHQVPIDTAIHLASPTPDFEVDKGALAEIKHPECAFNMKKIFNFFGSNDCAQVFGSLQSAWTSGRKTRPGTQSECIAYNVRTQLNGSQLNHSTIKTVIKHLPGLLHAAETHYSCFFDLDANLVEQADGTPCYPMVAIRKQSNDPHHPLLRDNYRRARAYSEYQSKLYKDAYGVNIQDKASLAWRVVVAPIQEWWCRAGHDKLDSKNE
ncbi:MAG: hypothetical protein AB7F19_04900 [Candidatus Babeliales bacterium]